jgi:integrase
LGEYGSPESHEAYARLIAEWRESGSVNPAPASPTTPDEPLSVAELLLRYLDFAEGYYVKDGQQTNQLDTVRRAIRVTRELYGYTPAADFGPLALRAIQQYMVDTPALHPASNRRVRYSRSTINSTCGCIKRIFKWAASYELVPGAVPQALSTVPGLKKGRTTAREPRPILPVPDDVVDRTIPHLTPVVADMVRFQRITGARPGEVCDLRPMDLDRGGEVWEYRPGSHKTEHHDRERIVFIGPQAQAVLLPYLLRPVDVYCFSPAESVAKHRAELRARRKTRVQPSQQNRRKMRPERAPSIHYGKDAYRGAIAKGIAKANRQDAKQAAEEGREPNPIPTWHPNQLRHSAATEIRKTFGLEAAQVVLGHAKADVTEVYAERDHALARRVALEVG